jgi:hypothetical protein
MINPEIEQLRGIVRNPDLLVQQRRDAAIHLIELTVASVQEPGDDDAEVVQLMQPWPRDTASNIAIAELMDRMSGKITQGRNLADAKSEVWKRRRLRSLLAVITDDTSSQVEKLVTCQVLLAEYLPPGGRHRRNSFTPESLLADALRPDATKIINAFKPPVTVSRPPVEFADVWRM